MQSKVEASGVWAGPAEVVVDVVAALSDPSLVVVEEVSVVVVVVAGASVVVVEVVTCGAWLVVAV